MSFYVCFSIVDVNFSFFYLMSKNINRRITQKKGPRPGPHVSYNVKIGPKPGPRGINKSGPVGLGLKCRALVSVVEPQGDFQSRRDFFFP